jgi:toxin HigB-1
MAIRWPRTTHRLGSLPAIGAKRGEEGSLTFKTKTAKSWSDRVQPGGGISKEHSRTAARDAQKVRPSTAVFELIGRSATRYRRVPGPAREESGRALPVGGSLMITCCAINATRYYDRVLRSFRDKDTQAVWRRQRSRRLGGPMQRVAWRKLAMLDAAETLTDLIIPPGNRLEKLTGDRAGQYSIRINQQWRICFVWTDAGPEDVEIVDYH